SELLEKNFGGERCPEELDGTLDLQMANANCCRFNRWGTLVAVGATDGRVFIIDFLTRGVVKQFSAHVSPIQSLSWSRDGRSLLTGSVDQTCVVWNVLNGQPQTKLKYAGMIMSAMFNPRDDTQLLVLPNGQHPSLEGTRPKSTRVVASNNPLLQEDSVSCAAYDRRGRYILTGTSKGRIVIYDAVTLALLSIVKQNSVQQIRNIVVPRRGCFVLTNSQDRVIKRYDLDELVKGGTRGVQIEPIQKLSDIVNKAAWKSVCCSYDGEYICGASTKAHSLYIWERGSGSLIKILHGTKFQGEALHDVQWHPTRAVILSVANGIVSVWTQAHVENWSAFAPEFTELEENAKYTEKEGEFDLEDEDASEEEKDDDDNNEDVEIDVVNLKPDEMGCSSDEEDSRMPVMPTTNTGPLWFIPVTPEIENPETLHPIFNAAGPYADLSFLRQPAGGMPIQYDDPNDLRRRTAATAATAAAKPMVKASRRPTK
ncbi:hypothetical protein PFISCL1PPCAC_6815, partial [Pristionchus fissidentatus]